MERKVVAAVVYRSSSTSGARMTDPSVLQLVITSKPARRSQVFRELIIWCRELEDSKESLENRENNENIFEMKIPSSIVCRLQLDEICPFVNSTLWVSWALRDTYVCRESRYDRLAQPAASRRSEQSREPWWLDSNLWWYWVIIKIANIIKCVTSDSSISAVSKRNVAIEYSFVAWSKIY